MDDIKKGFSIHFFLENKCMLIALLKNQRKKQKKLKKDKDHKLYTILEEYPNPEIREEGYINSVSEKEVFRRYHKDSYTIINVNLLPYNYKKNNQCNL